MGILTWNARTLSGAKVLSLRLLIERHNPDVVVVTEAEIPRGEAPPHLVGYDSHVPSIEESSRTRIVVYTDKRFSAIQIKTPQDLPIVIIHLAAFTLVGLYRQFALPGGVVNSTIRGTTFEAGQLALIAEQISKASDDAARHSLIVTGDINLDIARQEDPTYRRELLKEWRELMNEHGLTWLKTGPTFTSDGTFGGTHRESTLDVFYTRTTRRMAATVNVLDDATTDHRPIMAHLVHGQPPPIVRTEKTTRDWSKIESDVLINALLADAEKLARITSLTDVNETAKALTGTVLAAINSVAPLRKYVTPNSNLKLAADTRATIRARDAAKRRGALQYKQLRNKALSLVRRDAIQTTLSRIARDPQRAAWGIVAENTGKLKSATLPIPTGATSDASAANLCNTHLRDKITKLRCGFKSSSQLRGGRQGGKANALALNPSCDDRFRFHNVGVHTVKKAMDQLAPKLALGIDQVPLVIYKRAWEVLALPVTHLVNRIIATSTWPTYWKEAIVIPVLKPGKPTSEVASYRPIALLPALSKIVEKVLANQLTEHVEERGVLTGHQHGFRRGRSIDTAVAALTTKIVTSQDRGDKVAVMAFDYTAAFDTIDGEALTRKLTWMTEAAKALLTTYLCGRTQRVSWNGVLSNAVHMQYGVPQGSILGPLLFLLLTSDLPARIEMAHVFPVQYADDVTAIVTGSTWEEVGKNMSEVSKRLQEYSEENFLCLNTEKTQVLRMCSVGDEGPVTVLGVHLDHHLTFRSNNKAMEASLKQRIGLIRRLHVVLPRGPVLRQVSNALVVGKAQCAAWLTRRARVDQSCLEKEGQNRRHGPDAMGQVSLNDMARILVGESRKEKTPTSVLRDKAGVPSLNEVVVRQSAMQAWAAVNVQGHPLSNLLVDPDSRTRDGTEGLKRPTSVKSIAALNMANVWNSSPRLRAADTVYAARMMATKLANEARHA